MAAATATTASSGELTDELKDEIQHAYRRWLAGRGFKPRRGQREMIAHIARALTAESDRLCVVEAGTGTGKTVAYCLAAIPIAQALDKRVVISTATVALQEQVVLRDLPDMQRHAKLDFTFTLAKGRGRYVCLKRLDDRMALGAEHEAQLFEPPDAGDLAIYRRLQSTFASGAWDGELDSWPDALPRNLWTPVTNDRAGCGAGRCAYYHQCPFFRARRQVAEADVVVANHDLVLADLSLGGGVVLPESDETIFVLDEAHHLPEKTREHFTANVRLRFAGEWLTQVLGSLDAMAKRFNAPREVTRASERLANDAGDLRSMLTDMDALARQLAFEHRDEQIGTCRFPFGEVPEPIAELARPIGAAFRSVGAILNELGEAVQQVMEGDLAWDNAEQAENWLPVIGQLGARANASQALFDDYGDGRSQAARWATFRRLERSDDVELTSAPLAPGNILHELLWEGCYGAVATSATLCALGSFDRFKEKAGLGDELSQSRIPSPFDFPNIAVLSVPAMATDGGARAEHTEEVAALLPDLLALEPSALVLFTSWRQFNAVVDSLPDDVRDHCRLQDSASKQHLLREHRQAIDSGQQSYLFGLASFAEGVDLPGDYCRHVILAKLPFSVPDDPVDEAIAEELERQGRNPFFEMAVPEASLRLVQACGRLIRHESDGGRITLLDRRIVTRRYGQSLLASLPPYRLEIG